MLVVIFKIILVIVYLFFGFVCASIYDSWGFDDSDDLDIIMARSFNNDFICSDVKLCIFVRKKNS